MTLGMFGYSHAEEFYRKYGHLKVPKDYRCKDGYPLWCWILHQRNNHNNPNQYHRVTPKQAEQLEKIGMVWKPSEERWMEGYLHAKAYLESLRGESWKTNYLSPDGYRTGAWMCCQLRAKDKGILTPEKEAMLRDCGLWEKENQSNGSRHMIAKEIALHL